MKCPMCEDGKLYRRDEMRSELQRECPYCEGTTKVKFIDWLIFEDKRGWDWYGLSNWKRKL